MLYKLLIILIFAIYHESIDNVTDQDKIQFHNRTGIISLFPKNSGMFFNDRIIFYDNFLFFKKNKSLLPKKDVVFYVDINNLFTLSIIHALTKHSKKNQEFIALPSIDINKNVTGYMIEGVFGAGTKYVDVKGLWVFFEQYNLDKIIAIVPITYYVPSINNEGHGIQLSLFKNSLSLSVCYTIIIFRKHETTYKKIYSSVKQVYILSRKIKHINTPVKYYNQEYIDEYYSILNKYFIPYLTKQYIDLINYKKLSDIFLTPQKSLSYYLPH